MQKALTNLKQNRIPGALLFLGAFALVIYRCFPVFDFLNGHICSDWFIHYGSGFVRRGLMGSMFLLFESNALMTARSFLFGINLIYVSLIGYIAWKREFSILEIMLLYLGPFGILLCLVNGDYILNKEIFSLCCFYTALFIVRSSRPTTFHNMLIWILTAMAILNHEVYLFTLLPALLLIAYLKKGPGQLTIGLLVLGGVLFSILLVFKGNPQQATSIFMQLPAEVQSHITQGSEVFVPNYLADQYRVSKAISALGWDFRTTIRMMYEMTNVLSVFIYLVFSTLLIKLIAYFYLDKKSTRYLMISAIAAIPLFFFALDWGRWVFVIFHQIIAYRICFEQDSSQKKMIWPAFLLFLLYIPPSFTFNIWEDSFINHISRFLVSIL